MIVSMSVVVGPAEGLAEIGRMAGDAMEGWLRDYDGYRGLIVLTAEDGERARVLTFWDSPEAEQRSRSSRLALRDRMAATVGMTVEGVEIYDVPVLQILASADLAEGQDEA